MKLAIPNKGRLLQPTLDALARAGVRIRNSEERKLYGKTSNPNIQLLYARASDIPKYVEAGISDAGITGRDLVEEENADVLVLSTLSFGECRVVLAAPDDFKQLRNGIRIATKLPNLTKNYLKKKGISAEIIELSGAVELAPYLGIADAIVDHVSTGTTLAVNKLKEIETILASSACLIANRNAKSQEQMEELVLSLESITTAEKKRYVMANVTSEEILRRVLKVMPCMESPTVLNLAKPGEYAVHSVVDESELMAALLKLKKAGAKDILVFEMGRVIP